MRSNLEAYLSQVSLLIPTRDSMSKHGLAHVSKVRPISYFHNIATLYPPSVLWEIAPGRLPANVSICLLA